MLLALALALIVIAGFASWRRPRMMAAIFWSFIGMALSCAALLQILPGRFKEVALAIALLMPVIWVALIIHSAWDGRIGRVYLVQGALGLINIFIILSPAGNG